MPWRRELLKLLETAGGDDLPASSTTLVPQLLLSRLHTEKMNKMTYAAGMAIKYPTPSRSTSISKCIAAALVNMRAIARRYCVEADVPSVRSGMEWWLQWLQFA